MREHELSAARTQLSGLDSAAYNQVRAWLLAERASAVASLLHCSAQEMPEQRGFARSVDTLLQQLDRQKRGS